VQGGLQLSIRDDGVGIDDVDAALSAHGFSGMQQRVAGLGGTFRITSSPGKGTEIEVYVPL
jgi:signal transduction histidine kinase